MPSLVSSCDCTSTVGLSLALLFQQSWDTFRFLVAQVSFNQDHVAEKSPSNFCSLLYSLSRFDLKPSPVFNTPY